MSTLKTKFELRAKDIEPIFNPYVPEPARIKEIRIETEHVRTYVMEPVEGTSESVFNYEPGQFAIWSLPGIGEAPFSYSSHSPHDKLVEFTIHKIGKVTEAIFRLKVGDVVGVRGPYGNGFPIEKLKGKRILFIMGGIGAAPLRGVLQYMLADQDNFPQICVLHGARTPSDMLFKEEFQKLGEHPRVNCMFTVDKVEEKDKWDYHIGVVTTLFEQYQTEGLVPENMAALICGPPIMYKYVIQELQKLKIPQDQIWMTLERRMKCGVGKCGHCVIDFVYSCEDGPVFNLFEAKWFKDMI